jgi:hypothetical protein
MVLRWNRGPGDNRCLMPDDVRLKLTPTQQRLYEALVERRSDLGEWYRAAIAVINDRELPDRLSLAAHALREVMEKLPGDGIALDRAADLPTKVRNLQPSWETACTEQGHNRGAWEGQISVPLGAFLTAMQAFFDGQEQLTNSRREFAHQFMNSLDGTAGLPADVQQENAKQWIGYQRYFASVAHHKTVTETDFRARIAGFEVFIANRLKPRPTDDFAAIDALLEED